MVEKAKLLDYWNEPKFESAELASKLKVLKNSPLVSVCIPAFKPDFLKQAIDSVLAQTYHNIEIVICDDSTSDEIEKIVQQYKDKRIIYIKNRINLGGRRNLINCLKNSNGEYIKFLNDDDLLMKNCIETMVKYFEYYGDKITLITSRRNIINENNELLNDTRFTLPLSKSDIYINGIELGNYALTFGENLIGEPSTTMFRLSDAKRVKHGLFNFKNGKTYCGIDFIAWLNLLAFGDCIYISKPLSYFREHKNQLGRSFKARLRCRIGWFNILIGSRDLGYLKERKQLIYAIYNYSKLMVSKIWKSART